MQTTRVLDETRVLFGQPSKLGSHVTRSLLANWARRGVLPRKNGTATSRKRVTLEWAHLGGQLVTSKEAYQRFLKKINGEDD